MVRLGPILQVIGWLLLALSLLMLIPAAVDAYNWNPDWLAFVESATMTAFVGGALVASTMGSRFRPFEIRQGFLLTTMCWLGVTSFAALPFLGLGTDYTDAFFEAISGVTTTGSTVITDLDLSPPGILLWRALLQWIGGIGIVVMAILMLPFLRIGGLQLFQTESSDRSETIVPGAFRLTIWICSIYSVLTIACAASYHVAGMSLFDAITHAMTTVSTGGYSTHDESFGFFASPTLEWIATIFMLSGALPFVAYIKSVRGQRRALLEDSQVRALIGLLLALSLGSSISLVFYHDFAPIDAIRLSAFNIASIVTTTGYASTDYTTWGTFAVGMFLILTFVGGCTGSTAGGIKIYRFEILIKLIRGQIVRLISPNQVVVPIYSGRALPDDVPSSVLAFLAVFMATVGAFTVALTGMGLDLITALSASATTITNVGPGLGPIIGPAGNFASLPDAAKWILSVAMLLGRLEIFTVLVLLHPRFWQP